jgi:3-hydroxyacyl-[acyl-carrier-protein] dehydratase
MTEPDFLENALSLLPHGIEFRFVDRLRELNPGRSAIGEYTVKGAEEFLKGHFKNDPLLPGVILIEAAAQLAGVVAQSDPSIPPLENLKLTAVKNAKITGTVKPGETIIVRASILKRLGGLVLASAEVHFSEIQILKTQLALSGDVRL